MCARFFFGALNCDVVLSSVRWVMTKSRCWEVRWSDD